MRLGALILGLSLALGACADDAPDAVTQPTYVDGKDYLSMTVPVPTIAPADKVEVTEVFRFGCPHCYHFESVLAEWNKTRSPLIDFIHNPVVWDDVTARRATLYYVGQALKIGDETSAAIFKSIHEAADPRTASTQALMKDDDALDMFVSLGADRDKAAKLLTNSTIKYRVNQADSRARAFAIQGTPEMFVDGRYRVTADLAGTQEQMLKVVDFLVDKVAREKGLK